MPVPSGHETCRAGSQRARLPLSLSHYMTTPERERAREGKRRGRGFFGKQGLPTSFLILTLVTLLLTCPGLNPACISTLSYSQYSLSLSLFPPHALCTSPSPREQAPIIDGEKKKKQTIQPTPRKKSVRSGSKKLLGPRRHGPARGI